MNKTIDNRVIDLLRRNRGWPDSYAVTRETRLREDLGADSIDLVEVCVSMEAEFGLTIPDGSEEAWIVVGDVVKFLEGKA